MSDPNLTMHYGTTPVLPTVLGPVAAALIVVTAGIALAIGAGVVGWSYWWLLVPSIPAGAALLLWLSGLIWLGAK